MPVRELVQRTFESFALARAFDRGGIFDPPVRGHRLAGPGRTGLAGGIVADGEDEIEFGRVRARDFVPAFRAQTLGLEPDHIEPRERLGMDRLWERYRSNRHGNGRDP